MTDGEILRKQDTYQRAPESLWYAPDRRIRTDRAAREARIIAALITEREGTAEVGDEFTLFKALHTCAYNAARPTRGKRIPSPQRKRWAYRWRVIRDYIVEKNLPLVHWIVRRHRPSSTDEDTYISEASLVLVNAVERFNPWLGYRFSTYASNSIIRAILRLKKRESRHRTMFPVRHDDLFERPTEPDVVYSEISTKEIDRLLDSKMRGLTSLETRVLNDHFGLGLERKMSFKEIGDTVGLSKERIRQIQNAALHKLRAALT